MKSAPAATCSISLPRGDTATMPESVCGICHAHSVHKSSARLRRTSMSVVLSVLTRHGASGRPPLRAPPNASSSLAVFGFLCHSHRAAAAYIY